jgi:hypothetical protein
MFYIVLMIALNTVQFTSVDRVNLTITGADPGFQVGGAHLKKLRPVEGGAKIFEVFRVKNHDFTPKKSYFFQL